MKIAFHKKPSGFFDHLIKFWTGSNYTHVELIADENCDRCGLTGLCAASGIKTSPDKWLWYSASFRDAGVRSKQINPNWNNWDIFNLDIRENRGAIFNFLESQVGSKYDWLGIFFSQIIPLNIHNHEKWFCSELVHMAIILAGIPLGNYASHTLSPIELYRELDNKGLITKWHHK